MGVLEAQEEHVPERILRYKPLGFLGVIRSFFATCVGGQITTLTELSLSTCGCKKFACDVLGDHVSTCTDHSGSKKTHGGTFDSSR